jgi:hypothetical protein
MKKHEKLIYSIIHKDFRVLSNEQVLSLIQDKEYGQLYIHSTGEQDSGKINMTYLEYLVDEPESSILVNNNRYFHLFKDLLGRYQINFIPKNRDEFSYEYNIGEVSFLNEHLDRINIDWFRSTFLAKKNLGNHSFYESMTDIFIVDGTYIICNMQKDRLIFLIDSF